MLFKFNPIVVLFFAFFLAINAYCQNTDVNIEHYQTLSKLMNNVSTKHNVRFAFDNDLFSKIETDLNIDNTDLNDILKNVCSSYGLNYRIIGGTYVFVVDDQVKFTKAVESKPIAKKIQPELQPVQPSEKEYMISGIVRNKFTNEKLKNCNLIFPDGLVQTNDMGFFTKNGTTNGELKISINHVGYHPLDTLFMVESTMPVEIRLAPSRIWDQNISLLPSGKFFLEMPKLTDLIAINPKSAFHIPGFEATDLAKALTTIPGVNFLRGTNTGISIRGGNPSENLILVDGISVIETGHLMGNISVLNSKFINEAYVSRGGFGAEYGGSTSGIVDLTGKTGIGQISVVDFTANILHANLFVGLPINETTSMSGAFRKSLFDVWPNYLLENLPLEKVDLTIDNSNTNQGVAKGTIVNYYDANLKLSFRPSSRREFTINYLNSFDSQERDYVFDADGDFFQNRSTKYNTIGYSANLKLQGTNNWLNSFTVSYNSLYNNGLKEYGKKENLYGLRLRNLNDYSENRLQQLMGGWKSEYITKYLTQQFGFEYNSNSLTSNYRIFEEKLPGVMLRAEDSISVSGNMEHLNAYYQLKIEPFKWLRIKGGVRSIYDFGNDVFIHQPRYGIDIFPLPPIKLSYSRGNYTQHLYRSFRIDSNKNVSNLWYIAKNQDESISAEHEIVGIGIEVKGFSLNAEAYRKSSFGKRYFVAETVKESGTNYINYNKLKGGDFNQGVDVYLQFQHHIFKHLVTYSYSSSQDKIEGINNGNYFDSFDDQLHRFRFSEVLSYMGWTLSGNWFFASGNPYLLNNLTNTNFQFLRFNDFAQLDVTLIKEFSFRYLFADIGITFLNVLNKRNEVSMEYYEVFGELSKHSFKSMATSTYYTPLFFINIRYE